MKQERKHLMYSSSKKPKRLFLSLLIKACMAAGISNNNSEEIHTLHEVVAAQSIDEDCRAAFASAENSSIRYNIGSDEMLEWASRLNSTLQRVILSSLRPLSFHRCHYPLQDGHPREHCM